MKSLKDYEEDIYKCSRCGLCQSVCPVYQTTLNDCAVSRGKFNILNGVLKGDLNLSSKVKDYLDLCTGCNACKDFCPSKINVKEIFLAAKYEYCLSQNLNYFQKLLNSYNLFKSFLMFAQGIFSIYRFIRLDAVINRLNPLFLKMGILGKRVFLLNSLIKKSNLVSQLLPAQRSQQLFTFSRRHSRNYIQNSVSTSAITPSKNVVYFDGCFNKYLNSETKDSVKFLLKNLGIKFIEKKFECCGVSYLYDGNLDQFQELLESNLNQFNEDFDYVITDCASCCDVLRQYKNFSSNEIATVVSNKTIMVTDFIKNFNFQSTTPLRISVHKPCHDDYSIVEVVKNIKNINYIEVEDYDKCCGFSGKFALKNSEISREISKRKVQKYIDTKTDIILTTCPACILGLNQGLAELELSSKPIVLNLFVFLAKYCISND